jgi:hypothetical protein
MLVWAAFVAFIVASMAVHDEQVDKRSCGCSAG